MIKIKLIFICILLVFYSCNEIKETNTNQINIVAGISTITGRIIVPDGQSKDSMMITIGVVHPISGGDVRYDIPADSSGNFYLDFDIETETNLLSLRTSVDPYKEFVIKTAVGDSTHIDITYDASLNIKNVEVMPAMNKYDVRQSIAVLQKMIKHRPTDPDWKYPHLYDKSIDEFLDFAKNNVSKRLSLFVDHDNLLSKEFKDLIAKDYRMFIYKSHVFDYEMQMKLNYRSETRDTVGEPEIQKIDRSYFRFLKDFNLNDAQYLHTFTFPELQDSILNNEILGIPAIGESDISSWLVSVKSILADLVGFDDGPYYDILAANAYGKQFNEQMRPLSEKQKEHISSYWGNGEIAKILFRKNEQVMGLDSVKSPVVVHDVSTFPDDEVMEAIVSKYKGKVVLVDLWATWCAPCLQAMKQFRDTKGDYRDKDVVFVYITNGSSPKKLWEEKIKGIGSEHYYLTGDQWYYMMDHFGFEGIPSYLLFNREGTIINKFTAFPGNDKVKAMLDDLLNE